MRANSRESHTTHVHEAHVTVANVLPVHLACGTERKWVDKMHEFSDNYDCDLCHVRDRRDWGAGERAKRASLVTEECEAPCENAIHGYIHYSTTQLTFSTIFARVIRCSRPSFKMRLASLGRRSNNLLGSCP